MSIVEFERVNEVPHHAVETRDGARPVEVRRVRHGRRRNHPPAGIVGQRQAQAIAKRRPDEIDLSPARRTKRIMRRNVNTAAKAERR